MESIRAALIILLLYGTQVGYQNIVINSIIVLAQLEKVEVFSRLVACLALHNFTCYSKQ